jgi:hypothetical protein
MTHLSEEDLILAYYNEPGAPADAHTHLAECSECRATAESLARTLSICNQWAAPERSPEFGRDVWNRLVPQLHVRPRATGGWQGFRVWAAVAGFAVVLMAVFLAGRYSGSHSRSAAAPVMAGLSDQARERILAIAVADHLDRVQILLTEIANTSGPNPDTFVADRERAADLVQEGRLMRQSLAAQGESTTTNFLDEVERFLMEAAHTPDSASAAEVGDLRNRIESGSLLFKVRIVESNLRNEEQKL